MTDSAEVLPGARWAEATPEEMGFTTDGIRIARRWLLERAAGRPYRAAIVRGGHLVAHWCEGVSPDEQVGLASAAKSLYSSMLGIAIAEGRIGSADDRVVDVYPEMMDVPEGTGPKPGRFAREKDRAITFRQLISNTSGYLKPGEEPGKVFHYQTFGMNILCHAIAARYGCYDSADPDGLGGFGQLAAEKIRDPIGAGWGWKFTNFEHPPAARIGIFGNYTQIRATAADMARLGLLWLRGGRWGDRRIVPEAWLKEATRVAAAIQEHEPQSKWIYGMGFWTNEFGILWPNLPTDSFAAVGAGRQLIWVCPSLDLVVVESPGLFEKAGHENIGLLAKVVGAIRH